MSLANPTGLVFHPQDYDIEQRIEDAWQRLLKKAEAQVQAGKRAVMPFSGPLYRLADYNRGSLSDSNLSLELGATNFRESVGTNWEAGRDPSYKELLKKRGLERFENERAYFADALASCVAVRTHTEDGAAVYVVGLRSFEQDEYPLSLHVPGTLGNRKAFQGRPYDPFEAAWLECLNKEFSLTREDVKSIYCSGLVRNAYTEKPELAFVADISVPFERLASARHAKAPQRAEHFAIFPVTRTHLLELLAMTQDPTDPSFLDAIQLPEPIRAKVKATYTERPGIIANTGNWWVPPGEAALVLALAADGVDVCSTLPYLERA